MVVREALTVVHNNGHDKPEEGNERGTFSVKMEKGEGCSCMLG